ncbi:25S rRNA (adenine-N(1))-methyltransferase [Hyphodiscus hymeniophilus]|uniref:Ribosomal RNA-processing protein 8 n=1 Tax=Hyphodiscus hymeniophilus TaxID=353542 RepID=A0A9P7AXM3_9HELO|nr:25S rRNA (adenine-N(1))-methyltransferase [Hyphodiscus hymeniophilus]
MFAVPGWSVSSSALKTQTLELSTPIGNSTPKEIAASTESAPSADKKRKRTGSGRSKVRDVNATNLADLWETVIEGKTKPKSAKREEKRQKIGTEYGGIEEIKDEGCGGTRGERKKGKKKEKTLKQKRREKKEKAALESTDAKSTIEPSTKATAAAAPPPLKPTATLTPLQVTMRQKLISARFRHLNQTLYTTPSAHSLELFTSNPEMFTEYHEGFRRQVEVWPENPVSNYITTIKIRGKVRGPHRKAKPSDTKSEDEVVPPLPRTETFCTIADLGCGDAGLASGLQPSLKKLKVKIHSFDLQSPSPLVTKADIANLPLEDGSVDVAIFCLALMGTNWVNFIEEAFRILRWKGELWVAEIKSRFGRVGGGKNKRVEHSVGNRVKNSKPDQNRKASKKAEEDQETLDLAVEVDGETAKEETDVSAFVEVLRKRGFVLHGEVDLRNRMFVKMCFLKAATPIKGKGVPIPKGMAEMGLETWTKKPKGKFIEEDETKVGSEAAVLKPCVYKLR